MFCETDLEESLSKEITPFISAVVTIIYFSFAKKEEPYSFPLDDVWLPVGVGEGRLLLSHFPVSDSLRRFLL